MKKREKMIDNLKNLVEEQPNPKTEPAYEEAQEGNALSEKRKRALVNYLAILFGAAFLIVGISLVATWHNSRSKIDELSVSASSALSKVEALQAENQQLLQENGTLLAENTQLHQSLEEQEHGAQEYMEVTAQEYLESVRAEAALEKERVTAAYEFLLQAMQASQQQDRDAYDTAMERLDPLWILLDAAGQEEYLTLLDTSWDAAQ